MNQRPGLITWDRLLRILTAASWLFIAFAFGVLVGTRIEQRALKKALERNEIQLIYPHHENVVYPEGRWTS